MNDARISADLVALGRANRAGAVGLDDILPGEHRALSVEQQVTWLPYATVYARQMARAAWGAAVLVVLGALAIFEHTSVACWLADPYRNTRLKDWHAVQRLCGALHDGVEYITVACVVVVGCAIAQLVRRRAHRRFWAAPAERLVERSSAWTLGLEIAGATCLAVYLAVMFQLPDRPDMAGIWGDNPPRTSVITVVVPAMLVLAACVAVPHRHQARVFAIFRHRVTWLVSMALLYVTCLGVSESVRDFVGLSSDGMRSVFAAVIAVVAFVAITAQAVRARMVTP